MNGEIPGPRETNRRLDEIVRRLEKIEASQQIDSRLLTRLETQMNDLKDDIKRIEENQKTDRQDITNSRRIAVSTAFVAVALLVSIVFGILQLVLG